MTTHMKHVAAVFCTFLAGLFLLAGAAHAQGEAAPGKVTVAIQEIKVSPDVSAAAAKNVNKSMLLAELETAVRNSRKLALFTRQADVLAAVREEQQFAKSSLTSGPGAEEGKLGIAQLLIIPEVQRISMYREAIAIPNIENKFRRRDIGAMSTSVQIVDTSTGELKASYIVESSFSTKEAIVNSGNKTPDPVIFKHLAQKMAAKTVDELLDTVFPMLIVQVRGNEVIINRGQDGGLKKGMRLEVFTPGEIIKDPYTGENLGSAEAYAGKIEVTRVNPKMTTCRIVEGGPMAVRDIVRKPQ
ncbi:MAG: hypothetical protein ACK5JO_03950 [Halodesulfovibrio sp.]